MAVTGKTPRERKKKKKDKNRSRADDKGGDQGTGRAEPAEESNSRDKPRKIPTLPVTGNPHTHFTIS